MIKEYHFFGEELIKFDDSKTVKELVEYAFDEFGYYEPFGMDTVTVFQCYHSKSSNGWFTQDPLRLCKNEIENRDELCFAYYIPGFLYYAEGGWGHHMPSLGNHPEFSHPIPLKLKFEEFDHTVVFEGTHAFREVLDVLEKVGYIEKPISQITVQVLAYPKANYVKFIESCDPVLDAPIIDLEKSLPTDGIVTLVLN